MPCTYRWLCRVFHAQLIRNVKEISRRTSSVVPKTYNRYFAFQNLSLPKISWKFVSNFRRQAYKPNYKQTRVSDWACYQVTNNNDNTIWTPQMTITKVWTISFNLTINLGSMEAQNVHSWADKKVLKPRLKMVIESDELLSCSVSCS